MGPLRYTEFLTLPSSPPSELALSFAWKLFIDAQAFTRVPSTERWSSDSSGATSRCARIAAMILRDISVVSSRSRFFVNTVGTQTASSMPSPTNQRNSRL